METALKIIKTSFKIILFPTKIIFIGSALLGGTYKKDKSWWKQ